jgi:predicted DCC family thiol-disulfide oxidoreductase YuxK
VDKGEIKLAEHSNGILIVYDGDCPFCSNYVALTKLKESVGEVTLVNAREPTGKVLEEVNNLNLDLDEGMAVKLNGVWYHGADCIHILALLSSKSGFFNALIAVVFSNRNLSKSLYPLLRFFRNITLRLLGRTKINS